MKIKQLTLEKSINNSFHTRRDNYPKHHNTWHYHEECELIIINKGTGSLFIGDCIESFSNNDVFLIGSNLPHFWLFHEQNDVIESIDCIVIHFKKDFAGAELFKIPELKDLKHIISQSENGLKFGSNNIITALFDLALETEGANQFLALFQLLNQLQKSESIKLTSDNYSILNHSNTEQRMIDIMSYIRDNFRKKIELEELANEAIMTKNSFCRYFKQKTGKSLVQFISELRIAYACSLLENESYTLKEICFESGFNNFVSFHKVFKNQLNLTPSQYRKMKMN